MHRFMQKFLAPRPRIEIVPREALSGALERATAGTLTLVTAPAGFGKSLWLAQYAARASSEIVLCWVNLDAADAEATRFMSALTGAFMAGAEPGVVTERALEVGLKADATHALALLGERIAGSRERVVYLLDNYHLAESADTREIVETLLALVPDKLALIVSGRRRPGFALSAYRAEGRVLEFSSQDLCFTQEEADLLFRRKLSEKHLRQLCDWSGGWPAILQLARLESEGNAPIVVGDAIARGLSGHAHEYVAESVRPELSSAESEFLSEMSLFDSFDEDLADAIRHRDDSRMLIGDLMRFAPLIRAHGEKPDRVWLVPVVREYFLASLGRRGRKWRHRLYRSAATWLEQAGNVVDAVAYACRAGEFEFAAKILLRAGGAKYFLDCGVGPFRRALVAIPEHVIAGIPRLQLARIVLLLKEGMLGPATRQIEELREATDNFNHDASGGDVRALRSDNAIVQVLHSLYCGSIQGDGFLADAQELLLDTSYRPHLAASLYQAAASLMHQQRGNLREAERAAHSARRLSHERRNYYQEAYSHFHLATILFARGMLNEAYAEHQRTLAIIREHIPEEHELQAMSEVLIAEVRFEQNESVAAAARLHRVLDMVEQTEGWFDIYAAGFSTAAALAYQVGGINAAAEVLDRATRRAIDRGIDKLRIAISACHATLLVREDRLDEADRLMQQTAPWKGWRDGHADRDSGWRINDLLSALAVRLRIAGEDHGEAERLIDTVSRDMSVGGRMGSLMKMLILRSLARKRAGDIHGAVRALREGIRIAAPQGYLRPFLDDGADVCALIREHDVGGDQKFAQLLFEQFEEECRRREGQGVLSIREIEILGELHAGSSNKAIARKLGLSDNTVKFHLKRIFAKLDVRQRRGAVLEAQRLGFLPAESRSTRIPS
jgi:LuxR family maltose regulon positive regulatory protein